MQFGEKVRKLRQAKGFTLRALSAKVGVGFTYLSKLENGKLEKGRAASETLITKLAKALDGDEDELLILAEKVPLLIRRRVIERPDAFRMLAQLKDSDLDAVLHKARAGKIRNAARSDGKGAM